MLFFFTLPNPFWYLITKHPWIESAYLSFPGIYLHFRRHRPISTLSRRNTGQGFMTVTLGKKNQRPPFTILAKEFQSQVQLKTHDADHRSEQVQDSGDVQEPYLEWPFPTNVLISWTGIWVCNEHITQDITSVFSSLLVWSKLSPKCSALKEQPFITPLSVGWLGSSGGIFLGWSHWGSLP